ncbi:hypothetical protein D0Y65_055219 [Glycine soja]|uniref:Uncharacterized protein n=1 Tax=Glycine soja TaxID=3848 RepID=A0A445EYM6_GLYSO|nr:hypothetical protein D0Y65_055219 [Glycine soja]
MQLRKKSSNSSKSEEDRTSKIHNKDCELMGLTWLLAKIEQLTFTQFRGSSSFDVEQGRPDPQSCTLNSDGMPLAVDSSEMSDESSATNLQAPIFLSLYFYIIISIRKVSGRYGPVLPQELVLEILSWLPVIVLMRSLGIQGYTSSPSEDYTSLPSEDYTSSPSEDYMSSPSEGYTPSPLEDYKSSPSEGCTPSPSKGYIPSPLEGYMPSASEDYTSSPSEGYTPLPSGGYMHSPSEGYTSSTTMPISPYGSISWSMAS